MHTFYKSTSLNWVRVLISLSACCWVLLVGSATEARASEARLLLRGLETVVGRSVRETARAAEYSRWTVEEIQRGLGRTVDPSEDLTRLLRTLTDDELRAVGQLQGVRTLRQNIARVESRLRSAGLLRGATLSAGARRRVGRYVEELFPAERRFFEAAAASGSTRQAHTALIQAGEAEEAGRTVLFEREKLVKALSQRGVRAPQIESSLRAASREGLIAEEAIVHYAKLDGMPVVGTLLKYSPGLRNRVLADPRFFTEMAIEQAIGVTTTIIAHAAGHGDDFWDRIDLVTVDVVAVMAVDFALVYFLTPRAASRLRVRPKGGSWYTRSRNYMDDLPQGVFESGNFSAGQRAVSFFYKGGQFAAIGGLAGLGATALSRGLMDIRGIEASEGMPSSAASAGLWAGFLFLSSNPRYQLMGGMRGLVTRAIGRRPLALAIASIGLRYGNSQLGAMHWVRYSGQVDGSGGDDSIAAEGVCIADEPGADPRCNEAVAP